MPQMTIKPAFELGQAVYLKSDPCQLKRTVVGYYIYFMNGMSYELRHCDDDSSIHTLSEISDEPGEIEPEAEEWSSSGFPRPYS